MTFETAVADARERPAPDVGGAVPDWVQILPAPDRDGLIRARDGRVFRLDDPAALVGACAADRIGLAVDFDHAADTPALAGDADRRRAAGWIEAVEVRDGAVWGRVEWTPRARAMLAARAWRFVSPSMGIEPKSGRIVQLLGGALVHRPALHLKALASEGGDDAPMPDLATRLADLLGLDAEADDDAILAAVADALRAATPRARSAPAATAAARLDPAALALAAVVRENTALAAELRQRATADRIAKAEAAEAISTGTRAWATALAENDPVAFDEWLAVAAPVFGRLLQRGAAPVYTGPSCEVSGGCSPGTGLGCNRQTPAEDLAG